MSVFFTGRFFSVFVLVSRSLGWGSRRNPHILAKLVNVYGIAEHGTGYVPALWNPHAFVASEFYDEIGA